MNETAPPLTDERVDDLFAAIMAAEGFGPAPAETATPEQIRIRTVLGEAATYQTVTSPADEARAAEVADLEAHYAADMTSGEREDYLRHADKVINPNLMAAGYHAIETEAIAALHQADQARLLEDEENAKKRRRIKRRRLSAILSPLTSGPADGRPTSRSDITRPDRGGRPKRTSRVLLFRRSTIGQ